MEDPKEIAGGPFDKTGREMRVGDVVKVFHFVHYRNRRQCFMHKHIIGERTLRDGSTVLRFSHLDLSDNDFYVSRDGRHYPDYEIVQGAHDDFYDRPRALLTPTREDQSHG